MCAPLSTAQLAYQPPHNVSRAVLEPCACALASLAQRPSKGYAVVQLPSAKACRKLLTAHEAGVPVLHPYRFDLRPAKTPCSVYVGQLEMPYLTPALLRYIFADEQIAKTHLPHDESGRLRSYGFITFTTDATAQRIIKEHHTRPLGRGKMHPLKWASSNLLAAGDDLNVLYPGASGANAVPPLEFNDGLEFNEGLELGDSAGGLRGGSGMGRDSTTGEEPACAVLARAQELHMQAQAVGVHSVSSRLEMAARAQRLLEGLVVQLSAH